MGKGIGPYGVVLPFERCADAEAYSPPGPVTVRQMTPEEREKYGLPNPVPRNIQIMRGRARQQREEAEKVSEVFFEVPEGQDWTEVLTPAKYLELKAAKWPDFKIIKACRAHGTKFYAWKKENGLYGVGLREHKRRPDPDPEPPAEPAAVVQPDATDEPPEALEQARAWMEAGTDPDFEVQPARPVTCTCGSNCGPVCKSADPGPEPERKLPGANLPEGVRSWSEVVSREQVAEVCHLPNQEAAARLGMPFYAYKSLKRQYGLAHLANSASGRRVLNVTEAAIEAGKLREDMECCRRLLSEIEGLSGGVILALEQLANSAQQKLDAIDRVKVVI